MASIITKMTLKTGKKGFTLVEVMVAAAVLALGALFVYQPFIMYLDVFDYYASYAPVSAWMNQKMWEAQDAVMREGSVGAASSAGEFKIGARNYSWHLSQEPLELEQGLHKLELIVSWKLAKRSPTLTRTAFALYGKR